MTTEADVLAQTATIPSSGCPAGAVPGRYQLRLARTAADVRAAQLLRFMVFNLELREGLESSYYTMLDADRFDPVCDHLLVETVDSGEVVGTYRLQTGTAAGLNHGYYSEQEFDFAPYAGLRSEMVELGRACVRSDHRNFAVLNLLWKGIARYAMERGARWLIGCSSLTSQEPGVGAAAYRALSDRLVEPEFRTSPTGPFRCALDTEVADAPAMPRLLMGYLALGARICGPPALDREFKTIDFLTLFDVRSIPPRVFARFFH